MKKKTEFAVFTLTDSGLDFMVKGNFGEDKEKADAWAEYHSSDIVKDGRTLLSESPKYPHGLFVKKVQC